MGLVTVELAYGTGAGPRAGGDGGGGGGGREQAGPCVKGAG